MLYLPNACGAGLYYFFFALFVAFVLFAILAEAVVMILMKYNIKFKKGFLDSFPAKEIFTSLKPVNQPACRL